MWTRFCVHIVFVASAASKYVNEKIKTQTSSTPFVGGYMVTLLDGHIYDVTFWRQMSNFDMRHQIWLQGPLRSQDFLSGLHGTYISLLPKAFLDNFNEMIWILTNYTCHRANMCQIMIDPVSSYFSPLNGWFRTLRSSCDQAAHHKWPKWPKISLKMLTGTRICLQDCFTVWCEWQSEILHQSLLLINFLMCTKCGR